MNKLTSTERSPEKSGPLYDDDLSELTKNEILYWSRKLQLTPSELFTLSEQELERYLSAAHRADAEKDEERRREHNHHWRKLNEMKRQLLEQQERLRLRGGATNSRTVWEILADAASEIETTYGTDNQPVTDRIGGGSCGGGGGGCGRPMQRPMSCGPPPCPPPPPSCPPPPCPPPPCPPPPCAPPTPPPYFRNYTDYSMQYNADVINESTQSVTVEEGNCGNGKVSAMSRTFRMPRKQCPLPCPPPPPACPPPSPPPCPRPSSPPCPRSPAPSCPPPCPRPSAPPCPRPSAPTCPPPCPRPCPPPSAPSCPAPRPLCPRQQQEQPCPRQQQQQPCPRQQQEQPCPRQPQQQQCPRQPPPQQPCRPRPCAGPCPRPRQPTKATFICGPRPAKCPNLNRSSHFGNDCG